MSELGYVQHQQLAPQFQEGFLKGLTPGKRGIKKRLFLASLCLREKNMINRVPDSLNILPLTSKRILAVSVTWPNE